MGANRADLLVARCSYRETVVSLLGVGQGGPLATPESPPVVSGTIPYTTAGRPGGPTRSEEPLFLLLSGPNRGAAAATGAVLGRFTPLRRLSDWVATAAKTRVEARLND